MEESCGLRAHPAGGRRRAAGGVRGLAAPFVHTAETPFAAVASLPAHISPTCLRAVLSAPVTAILCNADTDDLPLPPALLDPSAGWVADDTLVVGAEVWEVKGCSTS